MKQKGFGLVEVMVAMVIGAFIFLAVAKLQVSNIRASADVRRMNDARSVASSEIANRSMTLNLGAGTYSDTVTQNHTDFAIATVISEVDPTLAKVEVTVTWENNGKYELTTYLPNHWQIPEFVPFAPLPASMSCVDNNKGHGNDFWDVDPDNPGHALKVPDIGTEVSCI